jgi:hypothetical protein
MSLPEIPDAIHALPLSDRLRLVEQLNSEAVSESRYRLGSPASDGLDA